MDFRPGKCLLPQILRERHIDPVDFYTELGWSKQHYSAYATGIKKMSNGTLKTVAHKLSLPMDDIYEWTVVTPKRRRQSRQQPE